MSRFAAELSEKAFRGLSARIGNAKRQDFVGRESVAREEASSTAAENEGLRLLSKRLSGWVGSQQKDIYLFGDATATAFSLVGFPGTRSPHGESPQRFIGRAASIFIRRHGQASDPF